MDILPLVKSRRSIRKFKTKPIPGKIIARILEAGRWAPSGLNNQPWRFMVLGGGQKGALAEYTKYSHIIKGADKIILVFLDKKTSYNYEKDLMAIGACWLGEILNQRKSVERFLKISQHLQLRAVIALGHPLKVPKPVKRKSLESLTIHNPRQSGI